MKLGTRRENLEKLAAKGSERAREELRSPVELPEQIAYLYGWALELHAHRRYGMAGPEPVTYSDVDAWARLTGRDPDPAEVRALMAITAALVPSEEG